MNRARLSPARLMTDPGVVLGLLLLGPVLLAALLAPWLPLADPGAAVLTDRLLPFGAAGHPLGTDQLGRDLLSRLIWGARTTLAAGAAATLLAVLLGTLLGCLSAVGGRIVDTVLMRGFDALTAIPFLLLVLGIIAARGPGLLPAMLAVAAVHVPLFARSIRQAVAELEGEAFVEAAALAGLGRGRILLREVLPNLLPVVFGMLATTLGWMILEIAGLGFLGLGAQSPEVELGGMLGAARELLVIHPLSMLLPALVLVLIIVGCTLLGAGVRKQRGLPQLAEPAELAGVVAHDVVESDPDADPVEALLRVRDLRVEFPDADGQRAAVAGVDLSLDAGERIALIGELGAGRTTMALALLRLVPPPGRIRASIRFGGHELMTTPEAALDLLRGNYIAYLPSDPAALLDPLRTVGGQLREAIRAHQDLSGNELTWRTRAALEQVRIAEPDVVAARYPHQLSARVRHKAAIAIALVNAPDLLIADEPTRTLDATQQEESLVLLDRLCREQDRALLFISHDPGVAARLCRRALVIYAGRIVEDAPLPELVRRPLHPYSRELIANVPELGRPDKLLAGLPAVAPELAASTADSTGGCVFAPRCRHVTDACIEQEPDLLACGDGRSARCIRVAEIAEE